MAITLPEITRETAEKGLVSRYEVQRLGYTPRVVIEVTEVKRIRRQSAEGEEILGFTPFMRPAHEAIEKAITWRFTIDSGDPAGLAELVGMLTRIAARLAAQFAAYQAGGPPPDVDLAQADEGEALAARYFAGDPLPGVQIQRL